MLGLLLRGAFVLAAAAATTAVVGTIIYVAVTYLNKDKIKELAQEKLKENLGVMIKDIAKDSNTTRVTLESLYGDDELVVTADSVSGSLEKGDVIYV